MSCEAIGCGKARSQAGIPGLHIYEAQAPNLCGTTTLSVHSICHLWSPGASKSRFQGLGQDKDQRAQAEGIFHVVKDSRGQRARSPGGYYHEELNLRGLLNILSRTVPSYCST